MFDSPITRNLLFFSLERWDSVWRRNQHFCSRLHDRFPDAQIIWINPALDPWIGALPQILKTQIGQPLPVDGFERIFTVDLLKPVPNRLGLRLNEWSYRNSMRKALAASHIEKFDVWVNDQAMGKIAQSFNPGKLIYDVTDDWTKQATSPQRAVVIREQDSWLTQKADILIVCSQELLRLKGAQRNSVHLVPNACELTGFFSNDGAQASLTKNKGARKVAGYMGTLHEDRLDVELVLHCAQQLEQADFVFVGPNCLRRSSIEKLAAMPNIHLRGAIDHEIVPETIRQFDVCMAPHVVTPFTESLDPIKLYEYIASAKPVVSTDCAGFRDLPEFVQVASNRQDFVEALANNFEQKVLPASQEARQAWAKQQTWDRRVDDIQHILGWS